MLLLLLQVYLRCQGRLSWIGTLSWSSVLSATSYRISEPTSSGYASQPGQRGDCNTACHDVNGLPRSGLERSMSGPKYLEHCTSQRKQTKILKSDTNAKGKFPWPPHHTLGPGLHAIHSPHLHSHTAYNFTCQQLPIARR